MYLHFRKYFFDKHEYSRIGYQNGIEGKFIPFYILQILCHSVQILVMRIYIEGKIYLYSSIMSIAKSLFHFIRRKVIRLCPEAEAASPEIDRIRAVIHSGL